MDAHLHKPFKIQRLGLHSFRQNPSFNLIENHYRLNGETNDSVKTPKCGQTGSISKRQMGIFQSGHRNCFYLDLYWSGMVSLCEKSVPSVPVARGPALEAIAGLLSGWWRFDKGQLQVFSNSELLLDICWNGGGLRCRREVEGKTGAPQKSFWEKKPLFSHPSCRKILLKSTNPFNFYLRAVLLFN